MNLFLKCNCTALFSSCATTPLLLTPIPLSFTRLNLTAHRSPWVHLSLFLLEGGEKSNLCYLFIYFVWSCEQKQTKAVGFRLNPSRIYVSLEMAALNGGPSGGTNLLFCLFTYSACWSARLNYSFIYCLLSPTCPVIYVKGHRNSSSWRL